MKEDVFICVDVETAGPNPADYALLSIGAAMVNDPQRSFYVELQPDKAALTDEAERTHKLDLAQLAASGQPPKEAMAQFAEWVQAQVGEGQPVFIAFNAPFDWMFVNDYFHQYLGYNPFGHRAVDIKAVFMGRSGQPWAQMSYQHISAHYNQPEALDHNAEKDAQQGAALFAAILADLPKAE